MLLYGWITPDCHIIHAEIEGHLLAAEMFLKQRCTTAELLKSGWVKLVDMDDDSVYISGTLSEKQKRELINVCIENHISAIVTDTYHTKLVWRNDNREQ